MTFPLNRTERLNLRLRPDEAEMVRKVARLEGKSLNEFARGVVLEAAKRRLAREVHIG